MKKPESMRPSVDPGHIKAGAFLSESDAAKSREAKVFLVKLLSCVLIALLFLVAAFKPGFATVLSCIGVIVACSVAAVLVDRRYGR